MRIALIGPTHPYKGGGARHTTELAHRLAAAGHDTVLESWRAQYPRSLYPGQQTVAAPEAPPYPRTRCELAWNRPDGWWRTGRRIADEADLVILTLVSPVQVPPYLGLLHGLRTAHRPPTTVAVCHNVLPHERRMFDVPLVRALLRRVDTVLTHSPDEQSHARQLLGGRAESVHHADLPPHLPDTHRAPAPRTVLRRLLFLGMVRPYKGVDLLVQALAAGPADVCLTVAGEFWGGSTYLRRLAEGLDLGDRVEFRAGYVPAAEVPHLFDQADALVLPYRSATATQNVWWAFEHNRPVIATRTGTLPRHVRDGVDGLICEPNNVTDLARTLNRFYEPGEPQRLAAAVRRVDPEVYWQRYLSALI
ncbi:glycosyltransferase [Lipingzhangella sp. LS1_29]|uniref:Glycosyltransferase n=1 Tax=Lipingzhangella rawalii TaxID=2055835 RepID=A0ABU2H343_9ACTN|nr:glycosyltransferase [Lipingzhangella rawalii]MDS1269722.1 glycosyltransferase [Lipingzhangella rawalii]